jgi:hypothetical protein
MSLFSLGQVVVSPSAARRLTEAELSTILRRHAAGDWGNIPEEQCDNNTRALRNSGPVFSVYSLGADKIVLVQTDGERRSSFVELKDKGETTFMKEFTGKLLDWRFWLNIISSTL